MTPRNDSGRWRKIEASVYESEDGRWRVICPWRLDTSLRHRWIVQERMPDGEWFAHDDDYPTMREARAYAESAASPGEGPIVPDKTSTPDALAVCQHPNGEGLYVPADDVRDGRCFQDCDCTPRTYVAVDALLNDEAVLEAAARAYAGERWWDSLPVDNEQKESHRRGIADAIEAALGAALPGTQS